MWKETTRLNHPRLPPLPPAQNRSPKTNCAGILDRLESTRDIFRENRELRSVLSRREGESQALRARNAELEEIMRQFAPTLLNIATTMGLAAKNEKTGHPERSQKTFVGPAHPELIISKSLGK